MSQFLSRRQAAEAMNVSEQTIDRLREAGQIQSFRVGKRKIGISAESLAAYIASIKDRLSPEKEGK